MKQAKQLTFGEFILRVETRQLSEKGQPEDIKVQPRPLSVLIYLAQRPRVWVSRSDLRSEVFRDKDSIKGGVSDNAIDKAVSRVKDALKGKFIESRKGEGFFRLNADTHSNSDADNSGGTSNAQAVENSVSDDAAIPSGISKELKCGDQSRAEGKYAEAIAAYERAVTKAEASGHKRAFLNARIKLAEAIIFENRNTSRAKELLTVCLTELTTDDASDSRSTALGLLGDIEARDGRIHESKSIYSEALEIARQRRDRFSEARFLVGVAYSEEMLGSLGEAHRLLDDAAEIYRREYRNLADKQKVAAATNLGGCYSKKATLYRHEGKIEGEFRCLDEGEKWFRENNSPDNLARTLLLKATAHFACSKWETGIGALDEAAGIFKRIENVEWLLRCYDVRTRLLFQFEKPREALAVCLTARKIASEKALPEHHIRVLLQTSALCHKYDLEQQATEFLSDAKRLAIEHQLIDELVDCLVDEAEAIPGNAEDGHGPAEPLLREAVGHLEGLLRNSEVKGRRAVYMARIGGLHGRLRNLNVACSWFNQALQTFEEIGDQHGIADCLASLGAAAREENNSEKAIGLFEALLIRVQGKSFHHFEAGAHHDLADLKLSQGEVAGARRHFDVSKEICEQHHMRDVAEALFVTARRLEQAERFRNSARLDIPTLLRGLHTWKDRYPQAADSILALWYHCFQVDLWANCRSMFGVKFLVRADSTSTFERFSAAWTELGDQFIFAACFTNRDNSGIDVIPLLDDVQVPKPGEFEMAVLEAIPLLEQVIAPELQKSIVGSSLDETGHFKLIHAALNIVPCFLMTFDGKVESFPEGTIFVIGHSHRIPADIQLMMTREVEHLISKRWLALPTRLDEHHNSVVHHMRVAHENGLLPVFFGALPSDGYISIEAETKLAVPASRPGVRNSTHATAKASLRRFMAEVGANAKSAFARLIDDLEGAASTKKHPANGVSCRLLLLKFKAGPIDVVHPVLLLDAP